MYIVKVVEGTSIESRDFLKDSDPFVPIDFQGQSGKDKGLVA